jgi:hypothetical protein
VTRTSTSFINLPRCRQGDLSAATLQQHFALALDDKAPAMFLDLAQLLSSEKQRLELLRAAQRAGWAAADVVDGADAEDVSPLQVCLIPSPAYMSRFIRKLS